MNTLKFRKLKELSSNLYFLILFFVIPILADLNTITVTQGSKKEYHIQPMTDYDTLLYNQDTTQKNNKRLFRICKVCRQINPCIQMTRQTLDM